MIDKFDAGSPITSGDLLEDGDGAPLPHELQPGGKIWLAVFTGIDPHADNPDRRRFNHESRFDMTADSMRALAPILWPLLPSNDHSPSELIRAAMSKIVGDIDWMADDQCIYVHDGRRCDRGAGHPGDHVAQS